MAGRALAILNALKDGPKLTRQLAAQLDTSVSALGPCLRELRARGFLISHEGVHELTPTGRVRLAEGYKPVFGPCSDKAASRRVLTLRQRAWRAMGIRDGFSLDDLLTMLCDGSEKDAVRNLTRYLAALEMAGYLMPLPRRGEGQAKRWRLRRDRITGPEAPAFNTHTRRLTDCNTGQVFELGRTAPEAGHGC